MADLMKFVPDEFVTRKDSSFAAGILSLFSEMRGEKHKNSVL
jgi:hypothetical protein